MIYFPGRKMVRSLCPAATFKLMSSQLSVIQISGVYWERVFCKTSLYLAGCIGNIRHGFDNEYGDSEGCPGVDGDG
jgi:hypothetical protein